jgi:hypothetical protein
VNGIYEFKKLKICKKVPFKTKNISEKAYLHLRENLGISHTPLREALFRLTAEGLLTHQTYKGFSIPPITLVEARELYETRELIQKPPGADAGGAGHGGVRRAPRDSQVPGEQGRKTDLHADEIPHSESEGLCAAASDRQATRRTIRTDTQVIAER